MDQVFPWRVGARAEGLMPGRVQVFEDRAAEKARNADDQEPHAAPPAFAVEVRCC